MTEKSKEEIGPTGDYPQGKLNESDEGALNIGLATIDGNVMFNFGKPIVWFAMPLNEAYSFAELIIAKANEAYYDKSQTDKG